MCSDTLVTTDGSERSLTALPHAARLARATRAELILGRILDPRIDCAAESALRLGEAAQRVSTRWHDELAAFLTGLDVDARPAVCILASGEAIHDGVLRLAANEQADVLAMSTRGAGLARHALLGSVALGVLARAPMPILMAGSRVAPPRPGHYYHVLVTTDGSPDSLCAVDEVASLARCPNLRATLLRVHVPRVGDRGDDVETFAAEEELRGLRDRFPDPGGVQCRVRSVVMLGGVDTAIVREAGEARATSICMATHGHSARHHLFAGSTALGVLDQSTLPVLLVRSAPPAAS